MEEMQRAFNKTIIKLQNTSRIAEEQVSLNNVTQSETSWDITNRKSSVKCNSLPLSDSKDLNEWLLCVSGPEADRFHPGAAESAGERD